MDLFKREVLDYDPEEEVLLLEQENDLSDLESSSGGLPYSQRHEQCLPFHDPSLKRLIGALELRLSIQDVYIEDDKCWYTLNMEHGPFVWSLHKRTRDFVALHKLLQMNRALLVLKLPEIKFEKTRARNRRSSVVIRSIEVPKVPAFPFSDMIANREDLQYKRDALEIYMGNVLDIPKFRNLPDVLEYLEIGPLSFIEGLGPKGKEGFVKRRCERRDTFFGCLVNLCTFRICPCWKKRWLFIKENFVGLMNPRDGQVESVLLLDRAFKVSRSAAGHKSGLTIQNLNRKLFLKCENEREAESWKIELEILDRRCKDFVRHNRYESFAPPRPQTECRWIVDGATYFEAIADVLNNAKEEIFIADWWLSPEIYLKRPTTQGHYWQLDYLLRRKASAGVRVYVLLYREVELALGINSYHTKEKLKRMHKNIKVLRHPGVSNRVLLWAHHEKIVCVDQSYAFAGGLDLCYGRWDDYQHRLSDFGDVEEKLKIRRHLSTVLRLPVATPVMRSGTSLPDLNAEIQENEDTGEEETVEEKGRGKEEGAAKEKIEEKTKAETEKTRKFKAAIKKLQATRVFEDINLKAKAKSELIELEKDIVFNPTQPADRRRTIQEMAFLVLGMDRKFQLWYGKDYANFINKDFQDLHQAYTDNVDRTVTPRMPWHDVGLFMQGRVARDIARHFILRWNHAKSEIHPEDDSYPCLLPKEYANFGDNIPSVLSNDTIGTIFRAECQVLRSLSYWSGNIKETECSIHEAYIDVIQESKHFLYIENQFFITQESGRNRVFNGISDALYLRILRADREKTPFHVYVVLPLLPAFEGELVKDPSTYISFYGLRTHGSLHSKIVTELVYVHSKMLIADDQVAIIGSANINDRSLLGRRDSEIAVMVKDTEFLKEKEGRPHKAGQFCHSLRKALFREHLGLMKGSSPSISVRDPSSESFSKGVWWKIANNNTQIYEEVFSCLPSDKVHSFKQLKSYLSGPSLASTDPLVAKEKLKSIRGYLVVFPFNFLSDENLSPTLAVKEHYLPNSVWT